MSESAEILCIGTEILLGNIVNTNSQVLSRGLAELGVNVYRHTAVGDNPERLREALDEAFARNDIVITTGGLGPTYDDLSKETIADWFGLPLEMHEPSARAIEAYFGGMKRPMCQSNLKQAMMPRGCTVLENRNGTAPGAIIEGKGKTAIMLPGPPRETPSGRCCPIWRSAPTMCCAPTASTSSESARARSKASCAARCRR
ncbi:MAG: molybdopterin-binding protein [Anaerotruncus massiliensis (ex Togo et al. 2019)]